jgi:hypothetical protein
MNRETIRNILIGLIIIMMVISIGKSIIDKVNSINQSDIQLQEDFCSSHPNLSDEVHLYAYGKDLGIPCCVQGKLFSCY